MVGRIDSRESLGNFRSDADYLNGNEEKERVDTSKNFRITQLVNRIFNFLKIILSYIFIRVVVAKVEPVEPVESVIAEAEVEHDVVEMNKAEKRTYTECPICCEKAVFKDDIQEDEYDANFSVRLGTYDYNIFALIRSFISNDTFILDREDPMRLKVSDEELNNICDLINMNVGEFLSIWAAADDSYYKTEQLTEQLGNLTEQQQISFLTDDGAEEGKLDELRTLRYNLFMDKIKESVGEDTIIYQSLTDN